MIEINLVVIQEDVFENREIHKKRHLTNFRISGVRRLEPNFKYYFRVVRQNLKTYLWDIDKRNEACNYEKKNHFENWDNPKNSTLWFSTTIKIPIRTRIRSFSKWTAHEY